MRAILLAAGFGTRLKPLTNNTPKCLMPVHGEPIVDIWLKHLVQAGIGPFLINTHYLHNQVENHIRAGSYSSLVTLTYEPFLLGTAGTLIANLSFFGGHDGLLIHTDNYCLESMQSFLDAHKKRPKYCLMTMMTFRTKQPSSCGIIEVDQHGVVVDFDEKPNKPRDNLANGAIYIISSQMASILASEMKNAKDFSAEIICRFLGKIYTYEATELLVDIGTPETYQMVNGNES